MNRMREMLLRVLIFGLKIHKHSFSRALRAPLAFLSLLILPAVNNSNTHAQPDHLLREAPDLFNNGIRSDSYKRLVSKVAAQAGTRRRAQARSLRVHWAN